MASLINGAVVFIFSIIIMCMLLDTGFSLHVVVFSAAMLMLQYVIVSVSSYSLLEQLYPLVVHLPCAFFFYKLTGKNFSSVIFVLFSAYIMTIPRKWFGLFISKALGISPAQDVLCMAVMSVFLILFTYFLVKPCLREMYMFDRGSFDVFAAVPALCYVASYCATVYFKSFTGLVSVSAGFLISLIIIAFFLLYSTYLKQVAKNLQLSLTQTVFETQLDSMRTRLFELAQSSESTRIMRHDMRHHLQMIDSYISAGLDEKAMQYIAELDSHIEAVTVKRFCLNTDVNLIISAYYEKAGRAGGAIKVECDLPEDICIDTTDVCVVLSNMLENALRAINGFPAPDRVISLKCLMRAGSLLIETQNKYSRPVEIKDGLPVVREHGHGIGTKSIAAIAEKHNGISAFEAKDGLFICRVLLHCDR